MKKLLFALLLLTFYSGNAQNPEYLIHFEGIGDNREYFNPVAHPQTILGTRAAAEIGLFSGNHRVRGGFSYLYEFGSTIEANPLHLTLYYNYSGENSEFFFGSFPRKGKINFPLAMLTDTLNYYRPNVEGMFGEVSWDWGKQNAFVDWYSRQTDVKREQFMAGSTGEIFLKNLFVQNYLLLFHDAKPAIRVPGDHIKDYMGYAIQAGFRMNKNETHAEIKAGILTSMFRDRGQAGGFVNATGFFAETNGRYKNYGVKSVLQAGASHKFYAGDLFYRAKNYWRTDFCWYFIKHKNVNANFTYSFHVIDWNDLDQQQQLSIVYVFGK